MPSAGAYTCFPSGAISIPHGPPAGGSGRGGESSGTLNWQMLLVSSATYRFFPSGETRRSFGCPLIPPQSVKRAVTWPKPPLGSAVKNPTDPSV